MNPFELYVVLLKATATGFAGLASLPMIQEALVQQRHVLTGNQLNEAVLIARSTPGPVGLYVVSVGYMVAGVPGAVAGWLAMITPALTIIPGVHFASRLIDHPRAQSLLQSIVVASAGLLAAAVIPLANQALASPLTVGIFAISVAALFLIRIPVAWVILTAAIVSTTATALSMIAH